MKKGKILGLGGVFFKAQNPKSLVKWYNECLGLEIASDFTGGIFKSEGLPSEAYSLWSAFDNDTDYFGEGKNRFMINFIVDDVQAVLDRVKEKGGQVSGDLKKTDFGDFGWVIDPEGNKIELWRP